MALLGVLHVVSIFLSALFVVGGLTGSMLVGVLTWLFLGTDTIKDLFRLAGKAALYDQMLIAFIILIGACVVMFLTGCFGSCALGKRRYSRCCQDTLALFAFILALLMLSGVTTTAVYRNELIEAIEDSLQVLQLDAYRPMKVAP